MPVSFTRTCLPHGCMYGSTRREHGQACTEDVHLTKAVRDPRGRATGEPDRERREEEVRRHAGHVLLLAEEGRARGPTWAAPEPAHAIGGGRQHRGAGARRRAGESTRR